MRLIQTKFWVLPTVTVSRLDYCEQGLADFLLVLENNCETVLRFPTRNFRLFRMLYRCSGAWERNNQRRRRWRSCGQAGRVGANKTAVRLNMAARLEGRLLRNETLVERTKGSRAAVLLAVEPFL